MKDQQRLTKALSAQLSLLLLAFSLVASPVNAQSDPLQGLDALIRESFPEWRVPGLAIAVVKDDEVVFLKGYGVREVGSDAAVDEHTIFPLSSNTKTFAAATVGILVDEGKLSWDDPVIEHLPWFRLPDPWVTANTTIRDLLAHRVAFEAEGLWVGYLVSFGRGEDGMRLPSREPGRSGAPKLDAVVHYLEPDYGDFRSRFQYCNYCYGILGEVIKAVSGMTWEHFLKARVLVPLGMTSTTADLEELWEAADLAPCFSSNPPNPGVHNEDARVQNIVMPHWPGADGEFRPGRWRDCAAGPAGGGLTASAADVAKWLRLLLGKGIYEGERILSSGVIEEMQTGQTIVPTPGFAELLGPGFGHFWSEGFGGALVDYQGRKTVFSSGGGPGVSSFIALVPEENLGVAVVMNRPGNFLDWVMGFGVLDAYLGGRDQDWIRGKFARAEANGRRNRAMLEASERELQAGRAQGTTPTLSLENYVGEYWHPAVGNVTITADDGQLVLRFPDAEPGYTEHWNYDVFRVTWNMPLPWRKFLTFVLDPAGRVNEFRIEGLVFQRLPDSSD
jgi:CubicO group peptidase (beta-lactamase class C family)